MAMREFHGPGAPDSTDTGTDSRADAHERHAGDSRHLGRAVVQDAETRADLAIAYRQHVEVEYAVCAAGEATPQGDHGQDQYEIIET